MSLKDYVSAVNRELQLRNTTEHSHRPALKALIEKTKAGAIATNEPKRIACGAPDMVVYYKGMPIGFLETKDIGVDLSKEASSDQLIRYRRAIENLILTDYLEFRWYVNGEHRKTARLGVMKSGRLEVARTGEQEVDDLLQAFLANSPAPIASPEDLSVRMARLAHMIRDIVIRTFELGQESRHITDLRKAIADTLIPDMMDKQKTAEFADMYAQCIVYGLFAARCNHKEERPFERNGASHEIPKTNPFLQKLFEIVTGLAMDDEPYVDFVEDLVFVLSNTRIERVLQNFGKRSGRDDPIVHFYETFLQAYDPRLRETRGVYFTPVPVVSYIVGSVDTLLRSQFGLRDGLADWSEVTYSRREFAPSSDSEKEPVTVQEVQEKCHRTLILDPACGTGTFLYAVVDRVRDSFVRKGNAGMWSGYVKDHLLPRMFGFELLMAPYAVAHFKLGMQLAGSDLPNELRGTWAYDFGGSERLGVYLTNTLEEADKIWKDLAGPFRILTSEARAGGRVKRDLPIMIVIGNPPYQGHSANRGKWVRELISDYQKYDGKPLEEVQQKWLHDDYVKFIRWAQWRIQNTGAGVLGFVTNHGYLDNPTFRGMRQQLMEAFTEIYILDLHGNKKKREQPPVGITDENVFDIQQGVSIGIFVKQRGKTGPARVHHAELWGDRISKYDYLTQNDVESTSWVDLRPQPPFLLFKPQDLDLLREYNSYWTINKAMPASSVGMVTARDHLTVQFTKDDVLSVVRNFAGLPEEDARTKYNLGKDARDWKVLAAQKDLKDTGLDPGSVVPLLYRPFDLRYTYYTGQSRGFIGQPQQRIMKNMLARPNFGLATTRSREIGRGWEHLLCVRHMIQHHTVSLKEVNYLFPLFLYPDPAELGKMQQQKKLDGSPARLVNGSRIINFDPSFIKDVEAKSHLRFVVADHGDDETSFGPFDLFSFIYAVLNSEGYKARYSEMLRTDYPRIPLATDAQLFLKLAKKGAELVSLHTMEPSELQGRRTRYPLPGSDIVESGWPKYLGPGAMELGSNTTLSEGRVYINPSQYFEGISPEQWDLHIGGYRVLSRWLEDRKGRKLTFDDIEHYHKVASIVERSMAVVAEIDELVGDWPLR